MRSRLMPLFLILSSAGTVAAQAEPEAPKPLHVFRGTLTDKEPLDPVLKKGPHKVHEVKLEVDVVYFVDLMSKDFDAYLRLEDAGGKHLNGTDGGGAGTDARLGFRLKDAGVYRLVVTSAMEKARGAYTLSVRRADERTQRLEQARSLHTQGVQRRLKGDLNEAARLFREAIGLWRDLYPAAKFPDGHANLANSLNSLGVVLAAQGKHAEALPYQAEALAIEEKVASKNPVNLGLVRYNLASTLAELGRYGEARPVYERALASFQRVQPPDHFTTGATASNLAVVLHQLGEYDEARQLFRLALDTLNKQNPPDAPTVATVLNNLGLLLRELGDFEEARKHLERALAIRKKVFPPNHPELVVSLGNLGRFLSSVGRREEALAYAEQALEIARKLPQTHPYVAKTINNLGAVLHELGKSEEARRLLQQSLVVREKEVHPHHPDLVEMLNNLGIVVRELGRWEEARRHFERAEAICKKAYAPDHPTVARCLNNLGMVLQNLGRVGEARSHLERALTICRKKLPPNHPDIADTLNNLAALRMDLGEHEASLALFLEALKISTAALPGGHPRLGTCLGNVGSALLQLGRREEARRYQERALAIREKSLPPDHHDLAASHNNLGALLSQMGERVEARRHLTRALAAFKKVLPPDHPSVALCENNLGTVSWLSGETEEGWRLLSGAVGAAANYRRQLAVALSERDHIALHYQQRDFLDHLLTAARDRPPAGEAAGELLLRVMQARGIHSAVQATRRDAVLEGAGAEARALAAKLVPLRRRLADLLLHGPGRAGEERHRQECEGLQRQVETLERELGRQVQEYAQARLAQSATPAEVAARLPAGAVLVEMVGYRTGFFAAAGAAGERRFAALLLWAGPGGPQVRWLDLGAAAPLEGAVVRWRAAVQKGQPDAVAERDLRERVWDPLAKALPEKTRRLILAPEGALALVPFEAIELKKGEYLIERYTIQYVSTGRDLMPQPLPKERPSTALILADPDYGRAGGAKGGVAPVFKPLPGFAREAAEVGKLLGGLSEWRVIAARGAEASEEKLAEVRRPRLLHCVTHGFFLEDVKRGPAVGEFRDLELVSVGRPRLPGTMTDPRLKSGLALAGANQWQERSARGLSDGLLTALEVENLDLWGTELVVLSACDTGRGEVQVGEGVLGLRRAFQLAGAQAVLASLWKVPDTETEQLMTDTLSRWLKGTPPQEALREAQLAMIRRLRQSDDPPRRAAPPLYWAAFICHGKSR